MKRINLISNLILAIAIIVLYVLFLNKDCKSSSSDFVNLNDSGRVETQLPVAYINLDSLLLDYNYSKDLNEQLLRKRENSQASYNQKARQFEQEAAEFQRKYENNAFLTQQRLQSEQQRLMQKQQELQQLDEKLSQELANEMQKMNEQLRDTIYSYLKEFNKERNYHLIFSNTMNDNILISCDVYDVTKDVVQALNARYAGSKSK
jgi:outer membrane protein